MFEIIVQSFKAYKASRNLDYLKIKMENYYIDNKNVNKRLELSRNPINIVISVSARAISSDKTLPAYQKRIIALIY